MAVPQIREVEGGGGGGTLILRNMHAKLILIASSMATKSDMWHSIVYTLREMTISALCLLVN